ncbi:hypothetical protein [Streptomyces sp. ICBB 8177]|uniref:hypothetical protein n=1 Tax=Streptomyces sp. ICBB 8177 TaxID=563922 RepID=UPI000D6743BC|nr:hypothetical protein [Streptomyces sp. ICBB 8177]PWI45972.1 hypothetical protein CK485_02190 [Streptomyces sp. ICBB 8177]
MRKKTPLPSIDELLASTSEVHLKMLEMGGYSADKLREMGASRDGAQHARNMLTMFPEEEAPDDGTTAALLDSLSEENRERLAAATGFSIDKLRTLCETGYGMSYLRRLLVEHTDVLGAPGQSPRRREAKRIRYLTEGHPDGPGARAIVSGWLITLATALVGLVLCAVLTVWIGALAIIVALLYFAIVLSWANRKIRSSPGSGAARAMLLISFVVIAAMVPFRTQDWYLAARGVQAQATVVAPMTTWSHGHKVQYCKVRLPNGSVQRTESNDSTCTTAIGTTATVVYDPSGWYGPRFGTSSGNNVDISGGVAVAALVALLAAPVWAIAAARRRKTHTK